MIKKEIISAQIETSFKFLGFTPRGNQSQIVFDVLDSFLNKGKRNVVLGAPTGIGKSVIGAVVSNALFCLTPNPQEDIPAIISMGTNVLAHQYYDSFSELEKYEVFQIKGASNYPCNFMKSQPMPSSETAEDCARSKLHPTEVAAHCNGCEYDAAKKLINISRILITNYSYFMISMMATGHLKPRLLHVFDEAHLLNDIFCNYTEILVSVQNIEKYIKELNDTDTKCEDYIAGLVMLRKQLETNNIGDNNYKQVLEILQKLYFEITMVLSNRAKELEKTDVVKSVKLSKLSRKYDGLSGKIRDFFDNDYEHVFDNEIQNLPNAFSVKTIFVGKMIDRLLTTYNLFMSATITKQFSFDTLSLKDEETQFIEVDPVFPKENKPILFLGKQALNYNVMKLPETIEDLKAQVKTIVNFHGEEKGLVFVPSFFLGSQLARAVGHKTRVFEHKSGMNLPELVRDFKGYKGSSILISPSIFEGLDFKGDVSRYQIIVKSPYPSLGDKRIKYISNYYPHIYAEMTLLKILQGIGRSVRSPEDYAVTYCLDASTRKLYESKSNIWKSHYTVKN